MLTRMRLRLLLTTLICLSGLQALAQGTPAAAVMSWSRLEQLPPNTKVKIKADHKTATCLVYTISEQLLVCSSSQAVASKHYDFPRDEIRNVKLSRKPHSALLGLALGAAVGAGAGAGIGAAINSGDTGSILHNSGGKSAAVGAGLGVIIVGSVGAIVGYSNDIFAGPVVYQR